MIRLTYRWFVAYYKCVGADGKDYFCVIPKRYAVGDNLLAQDKDRWALSLCNSKKDAFAVAKAMNECYERDNRLAITANLFGERNVNDEK